MCDYTARLPPELRRMVCELIPRESLKRVRLVNWSWDFDAAPLLWHTFMSDLGDTSTRSFYALLTSQRGGFLDSVRHLSITIADDVRRRHETQARLPLLVGLLRRGTLKKFTAEHIVDRHTVDFLVRRQPHLCELSLLLDDNTTSSSPPERPCAAANLIDLEVLTIRPKNNLEGFHLWFPYTPNLASLTMSGTQVNAGSELKPWLAEPRPLKLSSLCLDNLSLSPTDGLLEDWLDLDCLKTLTIQNCDGLELFLLELVEAYTEYGVSALKDLTICDTLGDFVGIDELDALLAAVSGLEYLYVSAITSQRLNVDSICCQASSLRYLVVEYFNSWDKDEDGADCIHDAKELNILAKTGSHIEELGISCAQINFDSWPPLEPFTWSPAASRCQKEKELLKFLDTIITFPKLRVLRMTQSAIDVLDDGSDGPFLERQWRYQQYAEQILNYLAERNSSVELLAFSPTRVSRTLPASIPDVNGHRWPHYYYLRAESETVLPKGQSRKQVVAVPVKPSEIRDYMDEPRILVDPKGL